MKEIAISVHFLTKTLDAWLGDLRNDQADPDSAQVLLVGGKAIDLDQFPQLRGIFKTGVGTDNLPFDEARNRGIEIALPEESTRQIIFRETADFACQSILRCLYRDTGDFDSWTKLPRQTLASKRLLVVGTGRIGSIVRDRMSQFCNVSTFDIATHSADELRPLMESADCVTLHIPLNEDTRHFFNADRLSWMKDNASLVNTARGPIIDETALVNELQSDRLFAALDVFAEEPYQGPLSRLPETSVLLTPHVASTCQEFLEATAADFRTFVQKLGQ